MLIIQGTADMSVPFPVTKGLYEVMLARGSNVEFLPVPNATHTAAIVEKNKEAVEFIQKYMPVR